MLKRVVSIALFITLIFIPLASTQYTPGLVKVYGYVTDWKGSPLADVEVKAYQGNAIVYRTKSGSSGSFSLQLERGEYRLVFEARGYAKKDIILVATQASPTLNLGKIELDPAVSVELPGVVFEIQEGSTVEIPLTFKNEGGFDEVVSIELGYPSSWEAGLYTSEELKITSFSLESGSSRNFALKFKIPLGVEGYYNVSMKIQYYISYTVVIGFHITSIAEDLTSLEVNDLLTAPGKLVKISLTTVNPTSWRVNVAYTIDTPQGWDVSLVDSKNRVVSVISLDPKASFNGFLNIKPPQNVNEGAYNVTLKTCMENICQTDTVKIRVKTSSDELAFANIYATASTYPGQEAKFKLVLSNTGMTGTLVELRIEGLPENYTYNFVDENGNVFRNIFVDAGEIKTFFLKVRPPRGEGAKSFSFKLTAVGSSSSSTAKLTLTVLGSYELKIATENFYIEGSPGDLLTFNLEVENSGRSTIKYARLIVRDLPEKWKVDVEPDEITNIVPGEKKTFRIRISVPGDAKVGDYYVKLILDTDLSSETRLLHVAVRQRSETLYVGIGIVLSVLAGLGLVYWKFGRR